MKAWLALPLLCWLAACARSETSHDFAVERPEPAVSGTTFLTPETQALQEDDFANPGYLWVDRGAALFLATMPDSPSCASCHGEDGGGLIGAAAIHPKWDEIDSKLVNLEGRINECRTRRQHRDALDYESDDLLALTTYITNLSKEMPLSVEPDPRAKAALEIGKAYFNTRRGQFNLSCSNCHTENWGQTLRGDTISQGHGNAFPAYRLEWQSIGSLHRRFQDCDTGVRAQPHALGSETYLALEYYLAIRGANIPIEAPGVRR
ncbi:MAG: sulfur oxidation c-type cytochrome SoxA [Pseudomonadota bacterium]